MIEITTEEDARTEMLLRELFRSLEDAHRNPFDLLAAEAPQTNRMRRSSSSCRTATSSSTRGRGTAS